MTSKMITISTGISISIKTQADVECLCGTTFCFKCYKNSHRPCTCYMLEKWEKKCSSDSDDDKWMKANCKECPHCHQKIEKSQGCNYMLCDKRAGGCGKAFCYVCEVDWEKHSKDHFNCNKYTEQVKQKENEANKLKIALKRYSFYFDRYMNYHQAVKLSQTKLRVALDEKINLLVMVKNLPRAELKFIDDCDKREAMLKEHIHLRILLKGQQNERVL